MSQQTESKYVRAYAQKYRGIWFNLAMFALVFLLGLFFYDRAIAVLKEQKTDWFLGVTLIVVVLAEFYFYPIKLKDIISRQIPSGRKKLNSIAFYLLLFSSMVVFSALAISALSFGFNPSKNPLVAAVMGWAILIRFAYFFVKTPLGGKNSQLSDQLQVKDAAIVDFGIAFVSSIYFICVWQAMILSNYSLSRFNGKEQSLTFEIIGFALIVMMVLLPIRALYFLEEWQGKVGWLGGVAIFFSLLLLIIETFFQIFSPEILG